MVRGGYGHFAPQLWVPLIFLSSRLSSTSAVSILSSPCSQFITVLVSKRSPCDAGTLTSRPSTSGDSRSREAAAGMVLPWQPMPQQLFVISVLRLQGKPLFSGEPAPPPDDVVPAVPSGGGPPQ